MAAIDVHVFLEDLKQLMMSSGLEYFTSQRDELQIVYEYVNEMAMLLKWTDEEGSTDHRVNSMAMHIRDLVFEAENIVDLFIVESISSGGGGDCDLSTKLDSLKGKMAAIIKSCKHGKFEVEWWYSKAADSTSHVVGLRPQIDKKMCRIKHGKSLEIISIVSLPGTGKTTNLAKQISNDHCTKEKFEIQVWIKVCRGYGKRDFLAAIVESLNPIFKETWDTDEEALGAQLLERLQDHKYLIVMNDMSTSQELFDLQTYLPDQCNGSMIVVTTWEAMVSKEIEEQDYYEPDVRMFIEKLKQLMSSGLDFVASQRDELQIVYEYVNEINMLLMSTEEEGSTDQKVNNTAMHIRDVVFEAENIVDFFIADSVSSGGGGDCDLSTKLDSVKRKMEAIIEHCKHGKFELQWWYMKAAVSTTDVVGLRPQINKIMHRFQHGKHLEIISIVGLPGTGKTTLAKQIYDDDCTRENFEIQAWINVTQGGYRKRDFLASILESFNPLLKENRDTDEAVLGGLLLEHLQDHKYLIVIDDMWSAQALFDLQTYLPDQCNGSKIIVTTQEAMVTKAIKEHGFYETYAIRLNPLSEEDSLELFKRKLPKELGNDTFKQCHGLPLAIAGISQTRSLWSSSANAFAVFQESYMENLELRYNELPPHLKACLLYIASFPEDYHIPVRRLVGLLIAEGFVNEEAVGIAGSLEAVVEGYISDLVDRCLVVVLGKRLCGATKTCRISSLMREFCSAKAKESKLEYRACSSSASKNDPRCLFIYYQPHKRISLEGSMQSLRSLLCFNGGSGNLINLGRIFCGNDFKLLKVLDLLSITITKFDFEVGVMVHLTYLAVGWEVVPESITNLFNLETLILHKWGVHYLPPGLLKMDKLRHICNQVGLLCFSRSGIAASSRIAGKLQTVYPLCGCTSCRLLLTKSPRIRNLGLSLKEKDSLPYNLSLLEDLETFKCCYAWPTNFQLQLPSSIKKLTLRYTYIEWEMISILGTLPNLEVLKLFNDAFSGMELSLCWDISGQEFPRLKCLRIKDLRIKEWVGNDVEFKSLEVLSIKGCDRLRMLPSGLARAPRLRTLTSIRCNSYVENFFASVAKECKAVTEYICIQEEE